MKLTSEEHSMLSSDAPPATSMAMRIVVDIAKLMGAERLVPITCAHIDGCIYYGAAGVYFAERLRDLGAELAVPATLNVGALDLTNPDIVRYGKHDRNLGHRLMKAYVDIGCKPSWTCAPYQAGYRPGLGEQIAWAESNAIVFANSVLGARTNRYGDYFDICAAITGRAPYSGLHITENRFASVLIDLTKLPDRLLQEETFYPVLGTWLGRTVGSKIAALIGLPMDVPEDHLKAMAAASASGGAVGLFHVIGVTPEAKTVEEAFGGRQPTRIVTPTPNELRSVRDRLSTTGSDSIDCVALGSPHFSLEECQRLAVLCKGVTFKKPVYVCTRPDVFETLGKSGLRGVIEGAGATLVVGTCVVVTPILRQSTGVLMTNSGKFAHYSPSTVGHEVVFGSLSDCVKSATTGNVERDESIWHE